MKGPHGAGLSPDEKAIKLGMSVFIIELLLFFVKDNICNLDNFFNFFNLPRPAVRPSGANEIYRLPLPNLTIETHGTPAAEYDGRQRKPAHER